MNTVDCQGSHFHAWTPAGRAVKQNSSLTSHHSHCPLAPCLGTIHQNKSSLRGPCIIHHNKWLEQKNHLVFRSEKQVQSCIVDIQVSMHWTGRESSYISRARSIYSLAFLETQHRLNGTITYSFQH